MVTASQHSLHSSRVKSILADLHAGDDAPETLAQRLCAACAEALPVTGVGMALISKAGNWGAIGATDGTARAMEDLQSSLGEGPCLDASRSGRPVLQPDLARTALGRWPSFGPAALEAGIAAVFAIPLQVGAIRLGNLDLYRDTTGVLDADQLAEALAFADAAVIVLLHLQNNTERDNADLGGGLHPQLTGSIETSAEIHQATGMITVQAGVELADAFLLLQARAYAAEQPVLEVARDVVARRVRLTPEDDHHE